MATYQILGEDVTGGGKEFLKSPYETSTEVSFAPADFYYDFNTANAIELYLMK